MLYEAERHEPLTASAWNEQAAQACIDKILGDAIDRFSARVRHDFLTSGPIAVGRGKYGGYSMRRVEWSRRVMAFGSRAARSCGGKYRIPTRPQPDGSGDLICNVERLVFNDL